MTDKKLTYSQSGVNIDEGNRFVQLIKQRTKGKKVPGLLSGIGGFGGLFDLSVFNLKEPVLVTSIDGVGTKLEVAKKIKAFRSVGIDIVAHSINDILVQGAKPLYFTDYLGMGKLNADKMAEVIDGIAYACEEWQVALIGGETAEMPGMYQEDDFDLVGSITGVVEKSKIITGDRIAEGDVLISIPSSGLHTNGYSLARKIVFEIQKLDPTAHIPELGRSIADALLEPHRCYGPFIYPLLETYDIKGLAHITGGGITENLPRILPENVSALISRNQIEVLPIFKLLQKWGDVETDEMYRVFNMGVGMIVAVSSKEADAVLSDLKRMDPGVRQIGHIVPKSHSRVIYES